uniref:Uncharacterized protein n=1 Tax=Sphaerodactylus townsendi TaxID=933632 RepID=A0ACB8EVL3_9SAUR
MPLPSAAPTLSECGGCLLAMVGLAFAAGLFIVISGFLCVCIFRGSIPPEGRGVPSVWRQGGSLWIEPARSRREPDVLSRPERAPLWISRSHDWLLKPFPAERGRCDSTEDLHREPRSPGSSASLSYHNEQTWPLQPHVTLQDLHGFFRHNSQQST